MDPEFKAFRQEIKADIELTRGLVRNTVRRQERQEALMEQHTRMIQQQQELLTSLMQHQLEGIQDFRRMDASLGKLGQTIDKALAKMGETYDLKEDVRRLDDRITAVEKKLAS
jgi:hypothetical protein